jgi:two-component system sensor histidine kinase KdpD
MGQQIGRWLAARWLGYAVSLAAVAAVTVAIGLILGSREVGNLPMLYLLAVLAAAIRFGRGPAIAASFAAFLAYDWFFIPPFHTLTIADPAEWVALLLFLVVAVITAQLAARERARAEEAERRGREANLLRRIGQGLGEADLDLDGGMRAAEARLVEELALAEARVALTDPPEATAGEDEPRALILPLRSPMGERIGTLTARRAVTAPAFDPFEAHLLVAVAAQLGAAIERLRLRREANEAETLRRTDELKSALLNAVSHDLRTPLASILASAGSLRQRDIDWTPDEQDEFAGAIVSEAQRLNGIVGNLLDLSRIEGGSLRPDKAWHDLGSLIADTTRRVRGRYPDHFFAVDLQEELPLLIDWVEIDQVLANLLENAAKYSPKGTKVWIAARRDGPCVRVQVADRGPGVPAAAQTHLFTPFYRVGDPGQQARKPGIGLGLAVARGLIEAHGGVIAVRNRDDGGALFSFTLPIGDSPPCPPEELAPASSALAGRAG